METQTKYIKQKFVKSREVNNKNKLRFTSVLCKHLEIVWEGIPQFWAVKTES